VTSSFRLTRSYQREFPPPGDSFRLLLPEDHVRNFLAVLRDANEPAVSGRFQSPRRSCLRVVTRDPSWGRLYVYRVLLLVKRVFIDVLGRSAPFEKPCQTDASIRMCFVTTRVIRPEDLAGIQGRLVRPVLTNRI